MHFLPLLQTFRLAPHKAGTQKVYWTFFFFFIHMLGQAEPCRLNLILNGSEFKTKKVRAFGVKGK